MLWRDRVVVILAFSLLTALAWSYLLWLSADMAMGGMDMGDFRMIPSSMGLMVPAHTPWQAMEFAFTPFAFVMGHGGFRSDAPGSLMLGLRHGAYCVGCCWALMALLFVGGIMNVLWIAVLALLVFLEKVTPFGRPALEIATRAQLKCPLLAASSTGHCNTARSLSAGVSKPKVFRGR